MWSFCIEQWHSQAVPTESPFEQRDFWMWVHSNHIKDLPNRQLSSNSSSVLSFPIPHHLRLITLLYFINGFLVDSCCYRVLCLLPQVPRLLPGLPPYQRRCESRRRAQLGRGIRRSPSKSRLTYVQYLLLNQSVTASSNGRPQYIANPWMVECLNTANGVLNWFEDPAWLSWAELAGLMPAVRW